MKRIYVLVEGLSEKEFVTRILTPYLGKRGVSISAISIKKSGGGGGFSSLEHFKNNVEPLLFEQDSPIITTMVDLYRFPVQSNSLDEEKVLKDCSENPNIDSRILDLENLLREVVNKIKPYPDFIPYIQKHEFEALLFSDPEVFKEEDTRIEKDIMAILEKTPNPEDINTTPDGHPAKRLEQVFSNYKKKYVKGADAVDFAELAGIEKIMDKCPRFKMWVNRLIALAKST